MRTVLSSHVQRNRPHGVTLMSVTGAAVSRSRTTLPLRGSHNLPCMYVCMYDHIYVCGAESARAGSIHVRRVEHIRTYVQASERERRHGRAHGTAYECAFVSFLMRTAPPLLIIVMSSFRCTRRGKKHVRIRVDVSCPGASLMCTHTHTHVCVSVRLYEWS